MKTFRFGLLSSVAVLVVVAVMMGTIRLSEAQDKADKVELMFVQSAENLKVDADAKTLRLMKVNQRTDR
jgi:predicted cation transporter